MVLFFYFKTTFIPEISVGEPMADVQDFFLKAIGVISICMIISLPAAHQRRGLFLFNNTEKIYEKTTLYFKSCFKL